MRTDRYDEDIVTFRNFANANKNCNFTLPYNLNSKKIYKSTFFRGKISK